MASLLHTYTTLKQGDGVALRISKPSTKNSNHETQAQDRQNGGAEVRWTQQQYESYQARRLLSGAKPQQAVRDDALGQTPRKESNPSCRKVSVVSYRTRLIDPDNLCVKYFIDALRYCGVLADDTAKHITLEVRQEKSDNPRTEITIE